MLLTIIGIALVAIWVYLVQLMGFQTKYRNGSLNPQDANLLVRNPRISFFTTFVTVITLVVGIVLLFIANGWFGILYFIGVFIVASIIRPITGNPLIGDWF